MTYIEFLKLEVEFLSSPFAELSVNIQTIEELVIYTLLFVVLFAGWFFVIYCFVYPIVRFGWEVPLELIKRKREQGDVKKAKDKGINE